MSKRQLSRYYVEVKGHQMIIDAKNKGSAARQAFKFLIRSGRIPRQPKTTPEGWFEDTFVLYKGLSVG